MSQNRTHGSLRFLISLFLIGTSIAGDPWVVREDGAGPVQVGMTKAQLRAALKQKLVEEDSGSDSCFYVHAAGREQISYMIVEDRVVRIDVNARGIFTASGLQVGDLEARARKIYDDKLKVTGHKYVDTGHYLTVRSADGRNGIRFETDKGRITMFYAGTYDAIQYVEGCL
jgi:hypothetical protein